MGERRGSERRKFLLHKLEVNNIIHLFLSANSDISDHIWRVMENTGIKIETWRVYLENFDCLANNMKVVFK